VPLAYLGISNLLYGGFTLFNSEFHFMSGVIGGAFMVGVTFGLLAFLALLK
jgi:hypothetical protein